MARRGASDGWDPPSVVEVTVVPGPRRQSERVRSHVRSLTTRRRVVVELIAAVAVVGAVVVLTGAGLDAGASRGKTGGAPRVWAPNVVAGVYRPLECLNLAVSATSPGQIDRDGSCWRYGVQLTAIVRDVGGVWRMGLAARSPSCPDLRLPPPVRAQLVVCRR